MRRQLRLYDLLEDELHTELFDMMADRGLSDIAALLTDGPDLLNIEGVHIPFIRVKTSEVVWVAYLNSCGQSQRLRIREILRAFFVAKTERFELRESRWEHFQNNCIAFRDGGNMGYTIWQYKSCEEENSLPCGHAELPGKESGCKASQRQGEVLRHFREKSSSHSSGIFPENLAFSESIRPPALSSAQPPEVNIKQ